MKREPTIDSVKDGLAKLIREVRLLQNETRGLHGTLRGFTGDRLDNRFGILPTHANPDNHPRAMYATGEPRSAIDDIRYEYGKDPNLEIPTRAILAISRELDRALRDIRAARNDIEAIADDSDLRGDFKEWQASQRKR